MTNADKQAIIELWEACLAYPLTASRYRGQRYKITELKIVIAAKDHYCSNCGETIHKGWPYRFQQWITDGQNVRHARHCCSCMAAMIGTLFAKDWDVDYQPNPYTSRYNAELLKAQRDKKKIKNAGLTSKAREKNKLMWKRMQDRVVRSAYK